MKRIRSGKYLYKGFIITNLGYYPPDKKTVWEAVDPETNEGVAHDFTLKRVKQAIDNFR